MITLAPKLIIQGEDKHKANSWIPWAKKRLHLLKRLPGLGVVNNTYRPAQGVTVRIKSVNGLDSIHIVTEGGKYSCDFPIVDRYPIPHSDFLIQCPVNPPGNDSFTTFRFFSRTNNINDISMGGDWENYNWDFGDGNVGSGAVITHEYDKPGQYTVSLTVSKDVASSFMFGSNSGGDHKIGEDNSFPGADPNTAYANYIAAAPSFINDSYKWEHRAFHHWQTRKEYKFESQETSRTFDLTAVDPLAIVTCKMNLILQDWVVHYPVFGDAGYQETGIASGVLSSLGVTATPVIGGESAPSEEFVMGDLTPFIGTSIQVTFIDAGGNAQLPSFTPGLPPHPNQVANIVGVVGSDAFAEIETAGTVLKTTKVIKVYSGTPGNKKSRQVGDSIHT